MVINSIKLVSTQESLTKPLKGKALPIVEIGKQSLVFETPQFPPHVHGNLLFMAEIHLDGQVFDFQFIGRVVSIDDLDGTKRVKVDLLQYDKQVWVRFLIRNAEKQEHADQVLRSIKGGG